MRRRPDSPASTIRRSGQRVSMGSWTAYVARGGTAGGRLIVALGRSAGDSVTRSRVRRLARDVFKLLLNKQPGLHLLLLARDDVRKQQRREIRKTLQRLMTRGAENPHRNGSARGEAGG